MRDAGRRDFLKTAGGALAAAVSGRLVASPAALAEDERPARRIVDCHTHFYNPHRTRPTASRPTLPKDYRKVAEPEGVTGTVVVEASPHVEDNQWILDMAGEDPFLLGLVGHLTPGGERFAGHLARFAKNPRFLGIRINHQAIREGLSDRTFLSHLGLLIDHDLELDVNGGPALLPDAKRLAGKLPKLRIVVNHMANVRIDGRTPDREWRAGMRGVARHERVFCKVSAMAESARRHHGHVPDDVEFYEPSLDVAWDAFGEERLIYASNWPVCLPAASYARVQHIAAAYFRAKGDEAADRFFWKNAQAAYRWPGPAGSASGPR